MKTIQRICVFCGANIGSKPAYVKEAELLAQEFVEHGISLVYGGGNVGIMRILANAMMEKKGQVIGVIPKALEDRELAHRGLTKLYVVSSMHERKALMADLSDGFILFPGGIGSLDEFFEIWTWSQLGIHQKPIGILNVEDYFNPLISLIDHVVNEGFLRESHRQTVIIEKNPKTLIQKFQNF